MVSRAVQSFITHLSDDQVLVAALANSILTCFWFRVFEKVILFYTLKSGGSGDFESSAAFQRVSQDGSGFGGCFCNGVRK